MKRILFIAFCSVLYITGLTAQTVKGRVLDENGKPLASATVIVKEIQRGVTTDEEGRFRLTHLPKNKLVVEASFLGYETNKKEVDLSEKDDIVLHFNMIVNNNLNEVEVFGERYKQPEKLDAITRMPLRPSEQIQSISVISDKVIAEQGALTITDVARNVPGVTLFGSYGGVRESMSIRGYRGVPVLKNGVRVDSDFRTASVSSDMQGVESIQIIKGSAAITQGIADGLGSAGGVINVVTKTPKFVNAGEVSVRAGSWGQFRPTFDVQSVLNSDKTIAFRLNGAYERADNYRPLVSNDKVYINPSLEWRPDAKTTITLEMDYLNEDKTPYTSTVNLDADSVEALYDMPHDKILNFEGNNVNNKIFTYAARATRMLTDKLYIRAAYFNSSYDVDNTSTSLKSVKGDYESRTRTLTRSLRDDKNSTFQLDFVGRDIYTGSIKHTFQVGFDYQKTNLSTTSFSLMAKDDDGNFVAVNSIDQIKVTGDVSNSIPQDLIDREMQFFADDPVLSNTSSYGIMAQEVVTFNKYAKAMLGLRYSSATSSTGTGIDTERKHAWDPSFGVMISPIENLNVFGSYTTSTSLRSAAQILTDKVTKAGPSRSKQWEVGIKSDWLDNRLRFNFTYFHILASNLTNSEYEEGSNVTTGYYYKAGDLKRDGVEVELNGRILSNLQVMLGYAYLNARYDNSPSYINGSAPMNAPKHTANGWIYYTVDKSALKGLSIGVGAYYVGKRPVNEYSTKYNGHDYEPNTKPFDMPDYTTINAQLAYTYSKVTARVFFNNIFDSTGYNAYYRGGFINQTDPRNFAAQLTYRF